MGKYKWLEENQIANKKYSIRLLSVIMLTAVAGVSFKIAFGGVQNTQPDIKTEISVQNEELSTTPSPSTTITSPIKKPVTGSGSRIEDDRILTDSGSSMEDLNTGTGASIKDNVDTGSGSGMEETQEQIMQCGQVDSNKNGVVDIGDMKDFERVYQKKCKSETFKIVDKCGQKDYNNDSFIDITDFVNMIDKLKAVKCV